jgi:predicted TPR repeat methyltransferase
MMGFLDVDQITVPSIATSFTTPMVSARLYGTLIWILAACVAQQPHKEGDVAEQLFRQALQDYRTRSSSAKNRRNEQNPWAPWLQLGSQLLAADNLSLIQRIGALEESILTIERAIYEMGQPDDMVRDQALAHLYYAYSSLLLDATPNQCWTLAKDPHTLLIGADQVTDASTFVCRENAENHLRNAITLDATHAESEELLAQILQGTGADGIHERKPKEFVAELFDSFADTFDEKLVKGLAYQVPTLIGQAAATQLKKFNNRQQHYHAVLDAGCGTGLAARHLRPLIAPNGFLIGVDASEKMLDIARQCTFSSGCGLEVVGDNIHQSDNDILEKSETEKALYDGLFAMDLEEMSVENTLRKVSEPSGPINLPLDGFDLVVAADVLVYFGRLDGVLAKFAAVSIPGASLIFSCERATLTEAPLGWRLLPTGRFAHTKDHVVQAAEIVGFVLEDYAEVVPRMEKGVPVKGHMFSFVLSNKGHVVVPHDEL